jgi:uncharacterized coiled-coil DUF342 family protein
MESRPGPEGDLGEEFRKLGVNLRDAFQEAWDSEERKRLQHEVEEGLADVMATLKEAAHDLASGPTGQRIKADLQDLGQRVQTGELEARVRQELIRALRAVNAELEKATGAGEPEDPAAER